MMELDALPWWEYWSKDNRAMPQTNAQRQEALRAKREMLGLTEVRGIYLPPALHQKLKEMAQKLAKEASKVA